MHPTRRNFLRLGLGSSALLAYGTSVPRFLAASACALAAASKECVLVALELTGGNDGLNTVVPYTDDNYRKYRPKIQVPAKSVHRIDERMGLHPALSGLAKLHDERQLAIVLSVGYPNPNRSHFRSMAIWQTAALDPEPATQGWLNRCLEQRLTLPLMLRPCISATRSCPKPSPGRASSAFAHKPGAGAQAPRSARRSGRQRTAGRPR